MKLFAYTLLSSALTATSVAAQPLPDPVQTYFVPLPEQDLFDLFTDIAVGLPNGTVSGNVNTVISIAIAADDTIIYYDNWEDGFEAHAKERTQTTTQIWGDGDLTNGIAPGTMNDRLLGGMAIVLENPVVVTPARDPASIVYDGRDRIQASLSIAITRFAYPDNPGSLMAGAVEVVDFGNWGRRFIAPVGQNTIDGSGTVPFEYSRYFIMAGEDNTHVFRNGVQIGGVFNTGESTVFAVNQGDEVTSNRPIQVDLLAADIGDKYELRWYAQVDANEWTNEYISPVAEIIGNTGFWFFNPQDYAINISWNGGNTDSGTFNVPAHSSKFLQCLADAGTNIIAVGTGDEELGNRYSGVRFNAPSGDAFYAFAQIDSNGKGQIYDWGFVMIPTAQLTSQTLVGLGQGCTTDCLPQNNFGGDERSVVWVTPIADTRIFVDYDGDGIFDNNFPLAALMSARLIDTKNNDFDMTGAIIASANGMPDSSGQIAAGNTPIKIAVVWGQDPPRSLPSDLQALDLGTAVLPLSNPAINKEVDAVYNPDGTLDPFKAVDQVGDIISYKIIVSNIGFAKLTGVDVNDPLIQDVLQGPVESKNQDMILERGETWTYVGNYTVTQADIDSRGGGDDNIENVATVSSEQFPPNSVKIETPIFLATISGNVQEDVNNNDFGNDNIVGVLIQLRSGESSAIIASTLTDASGNYMFTNAEAGDYRVTEVNLEGYTDVNDSDGGDKNEIEINGLIGGTGSTGNNFVDERPGVISGFVFEDIVDGSPISGVTLKLFDGSNVLVATTTSGTDGAYLFSNVTPGDYRVEQENLSSDYQDVSDQDNTNDGDSLDGNTVVDNSISVTINSNEIDTKNDFVDKFKPGSIARSPPAPTPPAEFCEKVADEKCTLCAPYRSLGKRVRAKHEWILKQEGLCD